MRGLTRLLATVIPLFTLLVLAPVTAAAAEPHPFSLRDLVVLRRMTEPRPAPDGKRVAYVLRTTSVMPDGTEHSRTGVFLAVAAVHFAPGSRVRPHERTHSGPKEDRRRLTLATGCNLSPIFLLVPDSRGDLAASLAEVTAAEPWAAVEAVGARQEVWLVPGQGLSKAF